MSLTLPSSYSAATKQGNIQENWIIQLGFFNGDAQGSGDGGWDAVLQADGSANLLTADVNLSATTIPVDDGTVFQANDYIKIESEIVRVVSISSNNLTVIRKQMGTAAEAHEDDDAIYWNNFTPIAFADTTVNLVFYHGMVRNIPSIRTSINLAKSTAKTGNISLSVINFQYKGDDFSAELLGTRKYINREVRIYSQLNGESTLSSCLQIYSGRLIDISHDSSSVSLSLTEQRPWDFITIPQNKSSKNNYFPVVYGSFVPNASTRASQAFCSSTALYPCPVEQRGTSVIKGLQPQLLDGSSGEEARLHLYEKEIDAFIPLTKSDNTYRDTSVVDGDGHTTVIERDLFRGFVTKGIIEQASSSNEFGIPASQVDTPNTADTSSSYSSASAVNASGSASTTRQLILETPNIVGTVTEGKSEFYIQRRTSLESGSANGTVSVWNLANSDITTDFNWSSGTPGNEAATTTNKTTLTLSDGQLPANYGCKINNAIALGTYSNASATLYVYDARLYIKANQDFANNKESSVSTIDGIKHLYCGADGLANSFTGGSGAADTGLEAHRDLLFRFAGFDDSDANIYNYDANLDIEATRITSAWNMRWWALKPVELKKVLEQIQYEFGFIFKFRHDGTGSYWYIKDSYSSGDVTQTFNKYDIAKLKINNTPFSELLTKMNISYDKHPAEDRFLSAQTSEDTTNNPRTNWNIQSKENIKDIKLEMNVNKIGNTNVGGNDPNDGFADYYMNIFGDIKKIISCDIVNSAKGYNLEAGDIVQFSNTAGEMPVEPFGDNWADYYMITNLTRSPSKVSITCREVS